MVFLEIFRWLVPAKYTYTSTHSHASDSITTAIPPNESRLVLILILNQCHNFTHYFEAFCFSFHVRRKVWLVELILDGVRGNEWPDVRLRIYTVIDQWYNYQLTLITCWKIGWADLRLNGVISNIVKTRSFSFSFAFEWSLPRVTLHLIDQFAPVNIFHTTSMDAATAAAAAAADVLPMCK